MNSTRAEICRNVKPVMIKYLNCSHSPARRKRHIACDELFHFITKLIARSFCCSSLPNRTRFAGLRFGAAASRRFCLIAKISILTGQATSEQSPLCSDVFLCTVRKHPPAPLLLLFNCDPLPLGPQLAGRQGTAAYISGNIPIPAIVQNK